MSLGQQSGSSLSVLSFFSALKSRVCVVLRWSSPIVLGFFWVKFAFETKQLVPIAWINRLVTAEHNNSTIISAVVRVKKRKTDYKVLVFAWGWVYFNSRLSSYSAHTHMCSLDHFSVVWVFVFPLSSRLQVPCVLQVCVLRWDGSSPGFVFDQAQSDVQR